MDTCNEASDPVAGPQGERTNADTLSMNIVAHLETPTLSPLMPTPTTVYVPHVLAYQRGQNYKKYFFKKNCSGKIYFMYKLQNSLFTKQIPSHVLLQTGTNQWQQHYKENVLVELTL